jgi:hypothetical protein
LLSCVKQEKKTSQSATQQGYQNSALFES